MNSFGFGPKRRVKHRQDFLRIQGRGKKQRSKNFLLSVVETREDLPGRLGVTVTRKVDKRAVGRNLIKRRAREIYRQASPGFSYKAEIVVIALAGSAELEFKEQERQLLSLFRKAGLLSKGKPRAKLK